MPSVYSVSRPSVWPSSTVMTPSLPTLSITSAMIVPTSGSAALIEATAAICLRLSTGRDPRLSSATIASTPFSMPRLTAIGLAPALTFWRPSATIAWPRTMAVVVPSPATSSVLVATSLRSWAPMFSKGSSSSISLAIVTPSLVIVGAPYFLSRTTFRPLGPSVTRTASAIRSTPCMRLRRAISSKRSCLATACAVLSSRAGGSPALAGEQESKPDLRSALDHREDVLVADDQQVLAVKLEFSAAVLRIEDLVALLEVHSFALAVVEDTTRPDGKDRPLLGLLFGGIRDHDATLRRLFARSRLNDHAVAQRAELLLDCRGDGGRGRLRGVRGLGFGGGSHGWFLLSVRSADRGPGLWPAPTPSERAQNAIYWDGASLQNRLTSMVSFGPMSIDTTAAPPAHLSSSSYLVLGLIEREGPSTPYELKRHVAATIGHFWSFPHALLYKEPARLLKLGMLTEKREAGGRRRRLFTITGRGRAAIQTWLATPSQEPTELRDAGLLQLFFADLGSTDDRRALAVAQLTIHRAALTRYEDDRRGERALNGSDSAARTVEHWRGVTLTMGLLYARAAVEF